MKTLFTTMIIFCVIAMPHVYSADQINNNSNAINTSKVFCWNKDNLHIAAAHPESSLLLNYLKEPKHLASIDHQDNDGNTPLHCAINSHSLKNAAILRLYKAEIIIPNNKQQTPIDLLIEHFKEVATKCSELSKTFAETSENKEIKDLLELSNKVMKHNKQTYNCIEAYSLLASPPPSFCFEVISLGSPKVYKLRDTLFDALINNITLAYDFIKLFTVSQ